MDSETSKRLDGKRVAAKTRLEDGEDSIDRAQCSIIGDKKVLRWSVRPHGYAQPIKRRTEAPRRTSDRDVKAKARRTAALLLERAARPDERSSADSLGSFIAEVARPALVADPAISENTRKRYLLGLAQIEAELGRLTIAAATTYDAMVTGLQAISSRHGYESARHAQSVLRHRVLAPLLRRGLIASDVLVGAKIDLRSMAKTRTGGRQGNVSLGRDGYLRVVEYLLTLDPADGAVPPSRGRWTLADVIAKRTAARDLALLQAATGMRVGTARQVRAAMAQELDGALCFELPGEICKGGRGYRAFVLEPRIEAWLRERLAGLGPGALLVAAPSDPQKVWDASAATKASKDLYLSMRDALGIEVFETERTHVFRATLNDITEDVVPAEHRAAQLGHTVEVNRASYTDRAMKPGMAKDVLTHLR